VRSSSSSIVVGVIVTGASVVQVCRCAVRGAQQQQHRRRRDCHRRLSSTGVQVRSSIVVAVIVAGASVVQVCRCAAAAAAEAAAAASSSPCLSPAPQ